ncbi:MAG: hypothetical protein WC755_01830 [Candidatus Woesearchaeota archaeon]|jgi:hypothetical protein
MADEQQKSKDEQIGFHKGALSTLAKEREEMIKIITIVEQLMQMHVAALKEAGVDLVADAQKNMPQQSQQQVVQGTTQASNANMEDKLKDWKL